MASQFSPDGSYFARISTDGKLKIWSTISNTFEQEFTPDFHLTSPCTCLLFLRWNTSHKSASPQKKVRRVSIDESKTYIALGTASGRLLIYSISKADVAYVVDSSASQSLECLTSGDDEYVYSGSDSTVVVWNLLKKNISSKWLAGNEKITAILLVPTTRKLLTASKNIKLWDVDTKELLKAYTGHSSQVCLLQHVNMHKSSLDGYFISGSKGDRLLNCWNLNEKVESKTPVVTFSMEDIVTHLSIYTGGNGSTNMAATVRSGVVHLYQHTFNGNSKPLKPRTTIQVASDSQQKGPMNILQITGAIHKNAETLCICYGNAVVQRFEEVTISTQHKVQYLVRDLVPKKVLSKEEQVSKIQKPIVESDVHYLTTQSSGAGSKRKEDGLLEVPMEKRLENLMMNDLDSKSKVPQANNVAKLLIQGLLSKDKNILRTVLFKRDEQLVKNTIKRIPLTAIVPLFEELTKLIQGKTSSRKMGLLWLKNLIITHSGVFLSNPDLPKLFGEALGAIDAGLALQASRNKLLGRLELLVAVTGGAAASDLHDEEPLLVFNDKVASDSDEEPMELDDRSNSENEWEEESSEDEDANESESDEDMTS